MSAAIIKPSKFILPSGRWPTIFDCVCDAFPNISAEQWRDRFSRARVLDHTKKALSIEAPHRAGALIYYFREIADEKPIPFFETILFHNDHLLVADKPHFLPVTPVGEYVEQTLLTRLIRQFENEDIAPLHRIDRHTAGLVLFSVNAATRSLYQGLFRERKIEKIYEAIAPALPHWQFPLQRRSRIVRGEPFFLSRECDGEPNTETRIEIQMRGEQHWHYRLYPITGKKHQLRVHMNALGAPIHNDALYPQIRDDLANDYTQPLQLLAKELRFIDPLEGCERHFVSRFMLTL